MRALSQADEIYVGAVNHPERLAAQDRFDPEAVTQHLETMGLEAHFASTNLRLFEKLVSRSLPASATSKPRVVVFFTNGSFDGIIERYVTAAKLGPPRSTQ